MRKDHPQPIDAIGDLTLTQHVKRIAIGNPQTVPAGAYAKEALEELQLWDEIQHRALGEFGATLMIAGNIPGKTQTLPTAIYSAVESNQMKVAWGWTAVVLLTVFSIIFTTSQQNRSSRQGA